MEIKEAVRLSDYTTLRLGGNARYFVTVHDIEELHEAVRWSKERDLAFFVLGGGSNVLIRDIGFDGLVIRMHFSGISYGGKAAGRAEAIAAAGENWDAFVSQTVAYGLCGLENLSGIPGTVGAAPVQNIGAYGREVKDVIAWVEAYDTESGTLRTFSKEECDFNYRDSFFKSIEGKKYIITHVAYELQQDGELHLEYKDLRKYFENKENPTLHEVRDAVVDIRSRKFPDLSVVGTAGSFFKNPIVTQAHYDVLRAQFGDVPGYAMSDGFIKIPIAWFLDRLGWKDTRRGNVGTWSAQPLVLVHYGSGNSDELLALADEIIEDVRTRTGITLEREVQVIDKFT